MFIECAVINEVYIVLKLCAVLMVMIGKNMSHGVLIMIKRDNYGEFVVDNWCLTM